MSNYPRQVSGRVSAETGDKIDEAIQRFKTTEGTLVRAALEDYMPRYLNAGQADEFAAKIAKSIEGDAEARAEVEKVLRKIERRRRQTVPMGA